MNLNFKTWITLFEQNLVEGSFYEADIPDFFYVGCSFSSDFAKSHKITPAGAAVSLFGLEGITSSPSVAQTFSNGVVIKMPGKELVRLNKISRALYDNPDYLISAGGRAARRIRSGSNPLTVGKREISSEQIITDVITNFFNQLAYEYAEIFPNYGYLTTKDGNTINIHGFLNKLESLDIKQWRKDKASFYKNIKNTNDLTAKISRVFKDILSPEHYNIIINDKVDNKPKIFKMIRDAASSVLKAHSGEKEWFLKRQALGTKVAQCPKCKKFTKIIKEGKKLWTDVQCEHCHTDFILPSSEKGELAARPVLNIPIGSSLFINTSYPLQSWTNNLISSGDFASRMLAQQSSTETRWNILVKKLNLHKNLNVHFSANISEPKLKFDPDKLRLQDELKYELKQPRHEKVLIHNLIKKGFSEKQVKDFIGSWENLGVIEKTANKLVLKDADYQEYMTEIYNLIKGGAKTKTTIANELDLDEDEVEKILDLLVQKQKIHLTGNNEYEILLSPEEMKHLSDEEKNALEILQNNPNDSWKIDKGILRNLILKQRIYKGLITGNYFLVDKSLSDIDEKVLNYLKKYPNSELYGIVKADALKDHDRNKLYSSIEKLASLNLISIDKHTSNDLHSMIKLNKTLTQTHEDAEEQSEINSKILKILKEHFITSYWEIAYLLKNSKDHEFDDFISTLFNTNLIKYSNYDRIVPMDGDYEKHTIEEKRLLEFAEKHAYFEENEAKKYLQENFTAYRSTHDLIQYMNDEDLLAKTKNPLTDEYVYHDINKSFSIDTSKEESKILEILKEKNKPLSIDRISEISDMSSFACRYILEKLKESSKVKESTDPFQIEVYYLPNVDVLSKEEWVDIVKKFLQEKPLDLNYLYGEIEKLTEHDGWYVAKFVAKMIDDKQIDLYSGEEFGNVVKLPNQEFPTLANYKEEIINLLKIKPMTAKDLCMALNQKSEITIRCIAIEKYINTINELDKEQWKQSFSFKTFYFIKGMDWKKSLVEKEILDLFPLDNSLHSGLTLKNIWGKTNINESYVISLINELVKSGKLNIFAGDINQDFDNTLFIKSNPQEFKNLLFNQIIKWLPLSENDLIYRLSWINISDSQTAKLIISHFIKEGMIKVEQNQLVANK